MVFFNKKPIVGGQFPNNEKYYTCDNKIFNENLIEVIFENNADLFDALLYKKYLDDKGIKNISLSVPFMPYGQMDRQIEGKVFSFKYFAQMINDANFETVYFADPHSYVMPALINRAIILYANLNKIKNNYDMFFYPDTGAEKKLREIYPEIPYRFGNKKRNLDTGEIIRYEVVTDKSEMDDKRILIVDDLIIRGGTYVHAAKALKDMGAKEVGLFITHTMPTAKDFYEHLSENYIDKYYTCNTLSLDWINPNDIIDDYIVFN